MHVVYWVSVYILLVPDKPQQLSIGEPSQVTHSNRKRWKYVVTWQVMLFTYIYFKLKHNVFIK